MSALGSKGVSAPLPDIHLKDIGKENEGASPAEAFEEILSALYKNITAPSVTDTLSKGVEGLGSGVKAGGESAKKTVDSATDNVKGLFKTKD